MKKAFVVIVIVILTALFFWFFAKKSVAPEPLETGKNFSPSPSVGAITNGNKATWVAPISNVRERITKKPFGIFVSPADSPVSRKNLPVIIPALILKYFPVKKIPLYPCMHFVAALYLRKLRQADMAASLFKNTN
ncbi:MAG: hypothetical protein AAB479_00495 [Patescibacteria group bacterium]